MSAEVTIAAGTPIAAEAGAAVARQGGNAVDGAIAAAIASMCTDIGIMCPGGGAFVTVWPAGEAPIVIDGFAALPGLDPDAPSPEAAMRDAHFDYGGPCHQRVGWGTIAVPGAFAALALASQRYGALPWSDVVAPAIALVRDGFPLTGGAAEYLSFTHEAIYSWHPQSYRTLHHEDGRPLGEGEVLRLPELAATLSEIARDPATLYRGALAERLAAGIRSNGGSLGLADLHAYEAVERTPLETRIGAWEVVCNPPPAVGGACLAAMLTLLDRLGPGSNPATATRHMVSAQHGALAYRRRHLDGAGDALPEAVRAMLELAARGDPARMASSSTSHVSAVDGDALACAITGSAGYGSGAVVDGTGFWLNNSLGEVDLHTAGLTRLRAGDRLSSNMVPTIARRDDGAVLAIGSPGASRITTAVAQVLANFALRGMSLEEAVRYPRLHVETGPDQQTIAFEPGLCVVPMEGLAPRPFDAPAMYFGGVQVAGWQPQTGLVAVADARRGGGVATGRSD